MNSPVSPPTPNDVLLPSKLVMVIDAILETLGSMIWALSIIVFVADSVSVEEPAYCLKSISNRGITP